MINADRVNRAEGSHWVSPVNFEPGVQAQYDFPKPLALLDSTLRKALYTPGTTVSIDGLLRIAEALADAGVQDECLNVDWWGDGRPMERELELCRAVLARDFGFRVNVFADTLLGNGAAAGPVPMREAVDTLAGLGAKTITPALPEAPSADAQKRQLDDLAELFAYAASCGLECTVTLAQVGLRDFERMIEISNAAVALGALRVDLMDSTSSLAPEAMKVFVKRYRARLTAPVPVTMHVHDDFGLATACAIAAATAGASPDVSMSGVSYRAGFAPLEEVAVSLDVLYGVDTGLQLERLQPLADLVAHELGVPTPPLKPLVGGYAFLRNMPPDVVSCLRDGVDAFPPASSSLSPRCVGAEMTWVWDSLSTDAMVHALAGTLGLELTDHEAVAARRALDDAVAAIDRYPRWLTPAEAERVCRDVVSGLRAGTLARPGA